ncbi:DUF4142 domain-containing protein [Bradyrhizobium sp. NC92]|uniref:DUF4142 domain-containing protein n=1 Tax=Bradyrhizobium sp. (strain NC92) TaxID=55395 RepID=UPI0021A9A11A|nr:DUF4142 domain-containing protein [Bradyrhizobium sp. NC92]UWU71038.1 DUF4142 domain-containing protein [Bradyrhizobium sp. NC92]
MRVVAAIILAFISTSALADSVAERKPGERPPSAIKGNAEVKNLAALRAEEAVKRDKKLKEVQEAIGAELQIGKAALASPSASLVEPEMSDGPAYVRSFYAAQIPEYESIIGLLERYLVAPDNAALAAFAREQLPLLRAQVRDAERTMADK